MASNKWQPVYEYKRTFLENVGMCIYFSLVYGMLVGGVMLMAAANNMIVGGGFLLFSVFGFVLLYWRYTLPERTRKKWRNKGIEYFNSGYISGYISLKTGNNLIGLYDGEILLEPIYKEIRRSNNFLLIKNIDNKWGVYNIQLSKFILSCEYVSLKENESGNLFAVKDRIRYEFSPYGSIVCKENLMDKFVTKMDSIVNKK